MATYYVSQQVGNDANAGTGPAAGQAWATFQKPHNAGMTAGGDTVYVGPGTYREQITCNNDGSGKTIAAASGTPPTSGGLVRSSGIVTVTSATPGDFSAFTTGKMVAIQGSTSGSFDGIFTIASNPTTSTFTYVQNDANWYADEVSGGGTAGLPITFVADPDCRYLTSDKPGIIRVTRCDASENLQSGVVINFNNKDWVHFRSYADAVGPQWFVDGSSDNYAFLASVSRLMFRQYIERVHVSECYAGFGNCHVVNATLQTTGAALVSTILCQGVIVASTHSTSEQYVFQSLGLGRTGIGGNSSRGICNIALGGANLSGGYAGGGLGSSLYMGSYTTAYTAGWFYHTYRDVFVPDEGASGTDRSVLVSGLQLTPDLKPLRWDAVRNLSDVVVCNTQGTISSSFDLSSESLLAFTPAYYAGRAKTVSIRVASTDGVGSVIVELQKYVGAAWATQCSKTIACSSLTAAAWNDFTFDTGTGDRLLTCTASLWRIRVTHSGPGTGTLINSSSATRTTGAYKMYFTPSMLQPTDIDGRWRPYRTYPDNYKCMIGPWELPATTVSYTAGDYQSAAPGIKIASPGDVLVPMSVKAGVAYTVRWYCKQVNCNSARLPQLRVWGNGITEQSATKANDSNFEQLNVTFTPAQDGQVQIVLRQVDYGATAYSLWSDWSVATA